jgi:hypothetical protein
LGQFILYLQWLDDNRLVFNWRTMDDAALYAFDLTTRSFTRLTDNQPPVGAAMPGVFREVLNTPPVVLCRDVTVAAGPGCMADVRPADVDNGSFDPDGGTITLSLSPAGPFRPGVHSVELTATDDQGLTAVGRATVTVVDRTAPDIIQIAANPNTLWPPNHKMVPIAIRVTAADACGGPVTSRIVTVSSNEASDGKKEPDWEVTGPLTLNLRAERTGPGDGRIYTITVECRDGAGNAKMGTVLVSVPKNRS